MPIDRVLQRMFLTFIDPIVEEKLQSKVFSFRRGRDAKMAVASVYFKLSKVNLIKQICLCSIHISKCFDNLSHRQIIQQYPFPKIYRHLLVR